MKPQPQKTATIIVFILLLAAIGAVLIVSRRVQKQSTTPTQSNAANCAMRFVVGSVASATPTSSPIVTSVPTPTSTPISTTPTPSPVGMYRLKVLAKFAGITTDRGQIRSDLQVQAGTDYVLSFVYKGNGIYEADMSVYNQPSLPTSLPPFSVKPEKHVQRVFKNMSVVNGVVDLTSRPFEPGDLPVQDGVVNLADINKVTATISKISITADDLQVADVNYDGVVNAADLSLILSTLSTRPDESL